MAMSTRATMVGVFNTREEATEAMNMLRNAGFREDQIGFAVRTVSDISNVNPDTILADERDEGPGAAGGALTGAIAGGATAALMVPAIGPVIAGGIFAAALLGAAVGAATGGVLGSLINLDVPENDARVYEEAMRVGRSVVIVRAGDRADEAAAILGRAGAFDIDALGKNSPLETAQVWGMGDRESRFPEHDGEAPAHAHQDDIEIEQTGRPEDAHVDHADLDTIAEERMEWERKQAS
jgi:hypothetical protein